VAQVTEANEAFRKGLALQTYADLEYGYQAYVMYTDRQYTMLLGSERVAAYEYARGLLRENLEKYPYDARTATYYGHVLDLTPPEVTRDEKESERVLLHAIELSPMRTQPWFMLANIYLRRADALPPGSERTKLYRAGMEVIERYAAVVPAKAEPHFILASLSLTMGERKVAEEHAKKGEELYAFDADAAKRASTYYVRVGDWVRAERFLGDLYMAEHAVETLYDYAKAAFLAGKKDEALAAAREVERANKTLYNTDKPFVAAITAYEQSLK
jgi:hypothetical protein